MSDEPKNAPAQTSKSQNGIAPAVLPEEQAHFTHFAHHYLGYFGKPPPDVIWHYTDANGLIGIIEKGTLFFTQVACLNDRQEQAYFSHLVHELVKSRLAANSDATLEPLLKLAELELSKSDFSSYGRVVACFSESENDLNQWRGYGGGECGYAIGFRTKDLFDAVKVVRSDAILIPMNYSKNQQDLFVTDVVDWAEKIYRQGIARGITDLNLWSEVMLKTFGKELEIFSSVLKHPSFYGEQERRIALSFDTRDLQTMIFRQKRTLLARILPIVIGTGGPPPKLPIANVWIGPGPAQQVSKIGVGDLLAKNGYQSVPVELSNIPYRIP